MLTIGVTFPQMEMETDPEAVRDFAQAVEDMGFAFLMSYDHVLGANPASRPGVYMPYNLDTPFHEPFVLFSYLSGLTKTIGFITGVLVLAQRQTVLVAKQAACLDVMSKGRFRLGVGTGWNQTEYEALGMDFATRGKRIEEQVDVLRALWTNRAVTFAGEQHTITDAGLMPMPVTRPIPVWFGGGNDRVLFGKPANLNVLRRIARIGDGWIQQDMPRERAAELMETFWGFCREFGRDPSDIGVQSVFHLKNGEEETWPTEVAAWARLGISHMTVNTMNQGHYGIEAHLRRLEIFRQSIPS